MGRAFALSVGRRAWRWGQRKWYGEARLRERQSLAEAARVQEQIGRIVGKTGKPLLVYVVPFDVGKLQTGGSKRVAGIAQVLAATYRVCILSLSPASRPLSVQEIAKDVWMISIPESREFEAQANALRDRGGGAAPLFAFADHFDLLPAFKALLERLAPNVQAWAVVSPLAWPPIRRLFRKTAQVLAYDAHDNLPVFIEAGLHCSDAGILRRAVDLEGEVLAQAAVAAFCTSQDEQAARARHPEASAVFCVVPNGVAVRDCRFVPPAVARENRRKLSLERCLAVFAGSNFEPNHEAVDRMVRELAPAFPRVVFVVVGMYLGPYLKFGGAEPGPNVVFTGPVPEATKAAIFALADVALAPMKSGTGSSLKIPDYVAHGKVMLGTPIGLRGFEPLLAFGSVIAADDLQGALAAIVERLASHPGEFEGACRAAREWVQANLDWSVGAGPLRDLLAAAASERNP